MDTKIIQIEAPNEPLQAEKDKDNKDILTPIKEQSKAVMAVMERRHEKVRERKKKFLKALEKTQGLVSLAMRISGIDSDCHYKWMKKDLEYKEKVEKIEEDRLDMAEATVMAKISENDLKAAMFYLENKGRRRGYGKSADVAVQVNNGILFEIMDNRKKEAQPTSIQ